MRSFDTVEYRQGMQECYDLIKATHDWEGEEGFIADGVICLETYAQQPLRILCVLAESYGYEHCGMTPIMNQGQDDLMGLTNSAVQTPRKLATLLWLLQKSTEQGSPITWDEFPSLFSINLSHTGELQHALSKVAWVNVKKASRAGGTRMIDAEVYEHATRNQSILRKQIELVAPDLIIICSEVVFASMHNLALLPTGIEFGKKWHIQRAESGPAILEVTHPSSWWGYEKLYNQFLGVYESLAKPTLAST